MGERGGYGEDGLEEVEEKCIKYVTKCMSILGRGEAGSC
jgi:hypothetical protein